MSPTLAVPSESLPSASLTVGSSGLGEFDSVDCQIAGLGEIADIQQIYVDHSAAAIDEIGGAEETTEATSEEETTEAISEADSEEETTEAATEETETETEKKTLN